MRQQVKEASDALQTRDIALARDLVRRDQAVNGLNRRVFARAVEVGENIDIREWAMLMILVARALERIGDNAVEIAEQTVFVITGLTRSKTV